MSARVGSFWRTPWAITLKLSSNVEANHDKNTPSVTPNGWFAAIINPLPFFLFGTGAKSGVFIPIEVNACFHNSVPVLFLELEIKFL